MGDNRRTLKANPVVLAYARKVATCMVSGTDFGDYSRALTSGLALQTSKIAATERTHLPVVQEEKSARIHLSVPNPQVRPLLASRSFEEGRQDVGRRPRTPWERASSELEHLSMLGPDDRQIQFGRLAFNATIS